MSVVRQGNFLGGQRIDSPHLRLLESGVCGDFDLLAGTIMAGRRPLVVTGFTIATSTLGNLPELLTLIVDGGVALHYGASASGTIFSVPPGRAPEQLSPSNPRVRGSFSANTTNYVGLDIRRRPDDSTKDFVTFLDDPVAGTEQQRQVPLALTLDYTIVITTLPFSATPLLLPVGIVQTDSAGLTSAITDPRPMLGRLAQGGDLPDPRSGWAWPQGRKEAVGSPYVGGDKAIGSLKDWMDAAMTRIWEVAGGERWSSAVSDRNVRMFRSGTTFGNGDNFEWDGTNLHWRGISFVLPNSTGLTNAVADQLTSLPGLTNLADGDCIYADLDYSADHVGGSALGALKAPLQLLGAPAPSRSRTVIAWRSGSKVYARDSYSSVGNFRLRDAVDTVPLCSKVVASCTTSPTVVLEPLGTFFVQSGGQWITLTVDTTQTLNMATVLGAGLAANTRYYLYIKDNGAGAAEFELSVTAPSTDRNWKFGDQSRVFVSTFGTDSGGFILFYGQVGRRYTVGGRATVGSVHGNLILNAGASAIPALVSMTDPAAPPLASIVTVQGKMVTTSTGPHTGGVGYNSVTGIDGMNLLARLGQPAGGQCEVFMSATAGVDYQVEDAVHDTMYVWVAGFFL